MGMVLSPGKQLVVVRGIPVPQGSMRGFVSPSGKAVVTTPVTSALARYRADIRSRIEDWQPGTGAMALTLVFLFPRPQYHWLPVNSKRPDPGLKPTVPYFMEHAPDIDKLCRAVLDALTGYVYVDDKQVVQLDAEKRWADDYASPGWTRITIEEA